jgi:hypothetical protein
MMNRLEKARALQHEPRVAAEVQVAAKRRKHLVRVCNAALTQRGKPVRSTREEYQQGTCPTEFLRFVSARGALTPTNTG